MTSKDFIKACIDRGYVVRSKIKRLEEWVEKHPKDTYDENCFMEAYRYCESFRYGEHIPYDKWRRFYGGTKTTKRYDN